MWRSMPRLIRNLAISILALPFLCRAHDVITTKLMWTQEISRIIYKHCVSCHREGGQAPMSLITYEESRPWAKAIRDEVAERRMPPWGAVKGFGQFRDDASLTDPEIEMLVLWVEGGAPKGDDIYLPAVPKAEVRKAEARKPAPASRGIMVRGEMTLERDITATGIAPREMAPGSSMQIVAKLPDGSIENLLWLRNTRKEWERVFQFREPIALPKGTLLSVHSGEAILLTAAPTQKAAGRKTIGNGVTRP
jgi:hypothetical protein